MGKHGRAAGRVTRHRYPVLAAGAVLTVVGVSLLLLAGGSPGTSVLASGESPGIASSSGTASSGILIHGCLKSGILSSVSVTGTPNCPSGATGISWSAQQLMQPGSADTASGTAVTPTGTKTDPPGSTSTDTSSSSSHSGLYFGLAPVGTSLPRSDAYCAAHVEPQPETVPANTTANHTMPSGTVQFGPWTQRISFFTEGEVDGDFTGTTGEILEWAACKWGWSQDYAMAEAVRESSWQQSEVGDNSDSYGILQVRVSRAGDPASANSGWGGYPWVEKSTALDADAQMAYLRACYDGDTPWLGNGYTAGNAWGCIGSWYSGDWLSAAAEGYISRVQAVLSSRGWTKL
jgi:hypothetical protein